MRLTHLYLSVGVGVAAAVAAAAAAGGAAVRCRCADIPAATVCRGHACTVTFANSNVHLLLSTVSEYDLVADLNAKYPEKGIRWCEASGHDCRKNVSAG